MVHIFEFYLVFAVEKLEIRRTGSGLCLLVYPRGPYAPLPVSQYPILSPYFSLTRSLSLTHNRYPGRFSRLSDEFRTKRLYAGRRFNQLFIAIIKCHMNYTR